MRLPIYSSFILFSALVVAAPSSQGGGGYSVKSSHHVSEKWQRLHRAPEHDTIGLRIGLKHNAFDKLESHLYQVSDPDSTAYGQWLEPADIHQHIKPHDTTSSAVNSWLAEHGVKSMGTSQAGDWLYIPMSVKEAERLLDTEYHVYKHVDTGSELIRTPEYSLPDSLHGHIDVVAPTNYFGDMEAMRQMYMVVGKQQHDQPQCGPPTNSWHGHGHGHGPGPGPGPWHGGPWQSPPSPIPSSSPLANLSAVCDAFSVTTECLRTLYNTVNYAPQVPESNLVGMTTYLNESANISDFRLFMSQARPDASPSYLYDVTPVNGGINNQDLEPEGLLYVRDLEGNLDSQTIGGLVYPTKFLVYSTGGHPPFIPDLATPSNNNEPYLEWVQFLLAQDRASLPNLISTSYGEPEQTVPYDYASRVCKEFAQLTSRGITLVFSSGDNGVGKNDSCLTNDGQNTPTFLPQWPATCPYVTAVGGTRNFQPEIVAYNADNGYASGSGVSNYFNRPSWQDAAFSAYQTSIGTLHSGLYNDSGRAYPDIAAQGYHFSVVYAGEGIILDGTSCSAPTASSVLALVNDVLVASGRAPLGFMNPWLYKYGFSGFTDIVNGSSWGCSTSGFPAKVGWDIASGWGTPDFQKLSQMAVRGAKAGYHSQ